MTEKMHGIIEEITLDGATFHSEKFQPTYINFFFGKNGAGKSTVAKAFEDPSALHWQAGVNPDSYTILVYNQDFITRNFATYGDLQGVFTLSEENVEIRKQINEKTAERDDTVTAGKTAASERDKKKAELEPLLTTFQTTCWDFTENVRKAFDKTQNGKKKKAQFSEEVLSGRHAAAHHSVEEISALYDIAYDPNARSYNLFKSSGDLTGVYDLSGLALLGKAITSSSDTDFARFMKAIKATDWVKSGHAAYAKHADGKCPFCQQALPESFEKDIAECFDEEYQQDIAALEAFQTAYTDKMQQLLALLQANLTDVFPKADTKEYEKKLAQLETRITTNLQRVAEKISAPAKPVELLDTETLIGELDDLIAEINKQIKANNDIVSTKHDKQLECYRMVWEEIAFILKEEVAAYNKSKKEIEDAAEAFDKRVKELQKDYRRLSGEITDLNSKVVNTKMTVDSINAHLTDSGFEGFRLQEKAGVKGVYEVIREDGNVAQNLSEGERNFIAFLYFYHIVRGSRSEQEAGKDKIVVIDDPVSSMDSSALFIVSALVREMLGVCSNNVRLEGHEYEGTYIKQMFILTHNAFFHREITYNMVGHYRYVSFYKVNKKKNISTLEHCVEEAKKVSEKDRNFNPVKNSYSALWEEFDRLDSPIPLMNVIRRILEYYFLQLCGYESDELCRIVLEDNKERFMTAVEGGAPDYTKFHLAQAMLSYIKRSDSFNDGLHFVDESIDCRQYKDAFWIIFEAMNQTQHYHMMMNERDT